MNNENNLKLEFKVNEVWTLNLIVKHIKCFYKLNDYETTYLTKMIKDKLKLKWINNISNIGFKLDKYCVEKLNEIIKYLNENYGDKYEW